MASILYSSSKNLLTLIQFLCLCFSFRSSDSMTNSSRILQTALSIDSCKYSLSTPIIKQSLTFSLVNLF